MKRNLFVEKQGGVDLSDKEMVMVIWLRVASGTDKEELDKFKQQEPKMKG